MKRLHLLVIRSFIGPFVLIFFIVLFILLMQFLWKYIDDLVGKGLEFTIIAELLLYTTSSLVPMALPLAILMSSLMTFGNMGEFNELTAIKASGISLLRILSPVIILVIFISIAAFFFSNEVLPYTNLKMRSLLYDVRNQRPEISVMPGTFYNGIDGYSLRIDKKNPNTNMMYNIKIYDHTQRKGNTNVTIADSGKMIVTEDERSMIFTLYNGYSYNELEEEKNPRKKHSYPHRFDKFEEQKIIIELSGFGLERTDENLFRNHYAMLDLNQLTIMGDSINKDLNSKKDILVSTLVTSNYFKKRNRTVSHREMTETRPEPGDVPRKKPPGLQERSPLVKNAKPLPLPENTEETDNKAHRNEDTATYVNLFDRLTLKEQDAVLQSAVSYARSARTYVVSSITTIDVKTRNLRKFEIEKNRKFSLSFACFLFLLIGAPLGAIIRKGGLGLPLVLSILLFIFYYIISLIGEKMVRESFLPSYEGMWISSLVFLITGIFLTYKAARDAAMLNLETYTNLVKKYLGIKRSILMDRIEEEAEPARIRKVKHDSIVSALNSFRESIADAMEDVNTRLKFVGFLLSLIGLRESTNIVLFERLYRNILLSIRDSDLREDKSIWTKLHEFPNFKYEAYHDLKWKLYLRLVLLCLPPITLLVMARHYIQLLSLRSKLKNIDQLTEDLIHQLQKHELFDSLN